MDYAEALLAQAEPELILDRCGPVTATFTASARPFGVYEGHGRIIGSLMWLREFFLNLDYLLDALMNRRAII